MALQLSNPRPPKIAKTEQERENTQLLYVVLENASLEIVRTGGEYKLLSGQEHVHILKKNNKDASQYRPDIVFHCLLSLLDSPLNKAGKLQIYIHTARDILIEISPHIRIPRTYARFAGLMVQLLQKLNVKAAGASDGKKLMKVVKNPVTKYLPVNVKRTVCTASAPRIENIHTYVDELPQDSSAVFVIGAYAKGKLEASYGDEELCISNYNLSGGIVCAKVCDAFENAWNIL